MVVFKNLHEAYICLHKWKKLLSLQDWDIVVAFVEPNQFRCKEEIAGEVISFPCEKKASIALVKEEFYQEDAIIPLDHELVLVHELIHMTMKQFCDFKNPTKRMLEEQFVVQMSETFVKLERSKKNVY